MTGAEKRQTRGDRMSWAFIAHALANRLVHNDACGTHDPADPNPQECPFCADAEAMRLYREKAAHQPPVITINHDSDHGRAEGFSAGLAAGYEEGRRRGR